jgi:hypothetical protein
MLKTIFPNFGTKVHFFFGICKNMNIFDYTFDFDYRFFAWRPHSSTNEQYEQA